MLHVVRHGRPLPSPRTERADWPLDPSGLHEVQRLADAGVLPTGCQWYTSPERKAIETARALAGKKAVVVTALREQIRPADQLDDYRQTVVRALQEPDIPARDGWEPASETRRRVSSSVKQLMARGDPDTVLVGHGTAWTLLVADLTGTPPDIDAWKAMGMPDHCAIQDNTVISGWGAWVNA